MSAVCMRRQELQNLFEAQALARNMVRVVQSRGARPGVVALVERMSKDFVEGYMDLDHPQYDAVEPDVLRRFLEVESVKLLKISLKEMEEEQSRHRSQLPTILVWLAEWVVYVRRFQNFREFKRIVEAL